MMVWTLLLAFLSTFDAQTCILTPELTVGPYYYDTHLVRQNISEGRPGVPFILNLLVMDQISCQILNNSAIDIWQCDAGGSYSWFNVPNTTFLRGIQFSDGKGLATFKMIYPGWYTGRATHIHIRLRVNGTYNTSGTFTGGRIVHTGQLFISDTINDEIALLKPYNENTAARTPNDKDGIYNQGGSSTLLNITMIDPKAGYSSGVFASVTLLVNTSANYTDGNGPNPPPGPPPGPPPSAAPNAPPARVGHSSSDPVVLDLTSSSQQAEASVWFIVLNVLWLFFLGVKN